MMYTGILDVVYTVVSDDGRTERSRRKVSFPLIVMIHT